MSELTDEEQNFGNTLRQMVENDLNRDTGTRAIYTGSGGAEALREMAESVDQNNLNTIREQEERRSRRQAEIERLEESMEQQRQMWEAARPNHIVFYDPAVSSDDTEEVRTIILLGGPADGEVKTMPKDMGIVEVASNPGPMSQLMEDPKVEETLIEKDGEMVWVKNWEETTMIEPTIHQYQLIRVVVEEDRFFYAGIESEDNIGGATRNLHDIRRLIDTSLTLGEIVNRAVIHEPGFQGLYAQIAGRAERQEVDNQELDEDSFRDVIRTNFLGL